MIAQRVPWLMSGSADLTGSAGSGLDFDGEGSEAFQPEDRKGRDLHLGIREHGSAALSNGLALSKLRPVWSTYLTFSDYARPAIRLSSLMELPVIHWFSHDSIGLGEDGPTHQPVEQLASLRAVPGLNVIRPCDANEVVEAWRVMMEQRHQPTALVLTRQSVPILDRSKYASAEGLARGGYVLADTDGEPDVILIATGSEVALAIGAYEELRSDGVQARVVSLPSWYLFDLQDDDYRESVLPKSVQARVAVEQASTLGWDRYVGPQGQIVGMHTFGASAPLKEVQRKFGFTPERVAEAAKELLNMTPTQQLHDLGQSLWLDNITRTILGRRDARPYRRALGHGAHVQPHDLRQGDHRGRRLRRADHRAHRAGRRARGDLLRARASGPAGRRRPVRSVHEETDGEDGFVSMEVSPLLADDAAATIEQARKLHDQGARDNLFIKIPGTEAGCEAIEESIYAGTPSTSRCSSRPTSTSPPPRRTCAASSGGSPTAWTRVCARWRRCS